MKLLHQLSETTSLQVVLSLAGIYLLLGVLRIIYNAFFHPLARFPGPRLAGATWMWRAYFEIVKRENIVDILWELHKKYGDVVRIAPNELHFSNPAAYSEIYTSRWNKDPQLYHSFGEEESSFGYVTPDEAKERRDVLNPLFSRQAIIKMQWLVREKVEDICSRFRKEYSSTKSADVCYGFRCMTLEIITSFCFGTSPGSLSAPEFRAPYLVSADAALSTFPMLKTFRWYSLMMQNIPMWVASLSPEMQGFAQMHEILMTQINKFVANPKLLDEKTNHPTIYHLLLNPKNGKKPATSQGLYNEAQALTAAGSDTVSNALMWGTFWMTQKPELQKRLQEELRNAWPDIHQTPNYEDLEKLPFLTAVIKESIRYAPGITCPKPRIVPKAGGSISNHYIPGGTVVGCHQSFLHRNNDCFENADDFNPDRWLHASSKSSEKWLVPFSKGPRMCFGQNLAWCELYISFGHLYRKFNFKNDGTTLADLKYLDCFVPVYPGRHFRVFVDPIQE